MLYLVRHGQTEFNLEGRYQGALDSSLTELGVAQAKAMGRLLKTLIGDPAQWELIVSPQGRARHTAQLVADACGFAGEPFVEPRIREISLGLWDGSLRAEREAELSPSIPAWERHFHAAGGETFEALSGRLGEWLGEATRAPERNIVAVSHGMAGRVIRGLYANLSREQMLTLDVPQDAVFRLHGGKIERIDVGDL